MNLGSGPVSPAGWINIDRSPSLTIARIPGAKALLNYCGVLQDVHMIEWPSSIMRHDFTNGLPFNDRTVEAVYTSHALEHVYLDQVAAVLRECRRVLRSGGILRIALPDAEALARQLLETGDGRRYNEKLLAQPAAAPTMMKRARGAFGGHVHRWQPTQSLIGELLSDAGFSHITYHTFREGRLPDIAAVEHRLESIFVESQ